MIRPRNLPTTQPIQSNPLKPLTSPPIHLNHKTHSLSNAIGICALRQAQGDTFVQPFDKLLSLSIRVILSLSKDPWMGKRGRPRGANAYVTAPASIIRAPHIPTLSLPVNSTDLPIVEHDVVFVAHHVRCGEPSVFDAPWPRATAHGAVADGGRFASA
jgi:hypothetical protein